MDKSAQNFIFGHLHSLKKVITSFFSSNHIFHLTIEGARQVLIRNSILAPRTGGIDSSSKAIVNHVPKVDQKLFSENEDVSISH